MRPHLSHLNARKYQFIILKCQTIGIDQGNDIGRLSIRSEQILIPISIQKRYCRCSSRFCHRCCTLATATQSGSTKGSEIDVARLASHAVNAAVLALIRLTNEARAATLRVRQRARRHRSHLYARKHHSIIL
jgi:hypothetical protein